MGYGRGLQKELVLVVGCFSWAGDGGGLAVCSRKEVHKELFMPRAKTRVLGQRFEV